MKCYWLQNGTKEAREIPIAEATAMLEANGSLAAAWLLRHADKTHPAQVKGGCVWSEEESHDK